MSIDEMKNTQAVHIESHGLGPDLVLLHGWGLNLRVWDPLIPLLQKDFRLLAVDLPGHGKSAWDESARTLAGQAKMIHKALAHRLSSHETPQRYALMGWSLGAQVALEMALLAPMQIEKLVLVAPTPRFVATSDWPHGTPAAVLEARATHLKENYHETIREFLQLQVRGSADASSVLQKMNAALFVHGEAQPEALAAGLETLGVSDLRPKLVGIETPALVIAGQYDRVTPPAASRALAEAMPHARYEELRRAAHAPFLSHTGQFVDLSRDFLHQP